MRTTQVVAIAALMVAVTGCGGGDDQAVTSLQTTTTGATTTLAPAPTTTAAPATAIRIPNHLRYGPDGLVVVRDGVEMTVVEGPVSWAADDRAGGVVYDVGEERWWLAGGAGAPLAVDFRGVPALVDSRPSLIDHLAYPCTTVIAVYDLATGAIDAPPCDDESGDSSLEVSSAGRDRYTAIYGTDINNASTDAMVSVVGSDGEVALAGNPYATPEECYATVPGEGASACDVDALLSTDGTLLATWYRPDFVVVWPAHGEGGFDHDAWAARLDAVPALVLVTEVDSGIERYRTRLSARTRLADFDGRFLVIAPTTLGPNGWVDDDGTWTIVDVTGQQPPIDVDGGVALLHSAPGLGDSVEVDGVFGADTGTGVRQVQTAAGIEIDGVAGPDTWAVLGIGTTAHPRRAGQDLAILRPEGIASADLGTPADEAFSDLTDLRVPPASDDAWSSGFGRDPAIRRDAGAAPSRPARRCRP